ncbi:MAG: DUF2652 domain-containing protein [Lutibacter sp.]|nr:DUF2652 domain-containing protein [Lutibacter sp.]
MEKALYFMPDISGFTKFVNNTEIEHGIHIIGELLELLIDSNTINLQLVEIEGDALFMFTSEIPTYGQLLEQTTFMLENFHKHTKSYESKRICNCGSCRTTTNLELKFLVHYGELAFIKVKNFVKPYGQDVIKIHRLLKNQVPVNEYLLFTNDAYNLYKSQVDETWVKKSETYDLKSLEYFYKNLENIKKNVQIAAINRNDEVIENTLPTITLEKIIDDNEQNIFTYISELKYRHLWDKEVKRIEFDENKVNRIGTQHNCVINIGNLNFETIAQENTDDLIYGESTKDMMFTKNFSYFIKLHKIAENKTKVEVNLFLELNTIGTFMKSNIVKMIKKMWNNKLDQLALVLKNKNQFPNL